MWRKYCQWDRGKLVDSGHNTEVPLSAFLLHFCTKCNINIVSQFCPMSTNYPKILHDISVIGSRDHFITSATNPSSSTGRQTAVHQRYTAEQG